MTFQPLKQKIVREISVAIPLVEAFLERLRNASEETPIAELEDLCNFLWSLPLIDTESQLYTDLSWSIEELIRKQSEQNREAYAQYDEPYGEFHGLKKK